MFIYYGYVISNICSNNVWPSELIKVSYFIIKNIVQILKIFITHHFLNVIHIQPHNKINFLNLVIAIKLKLDFSFHFIPNHCKWDWPCFEHFLGHNVHAMLSMSKCQDHTYQHQVVLKGMIIVLFFTPFTNFGIKIQHCMKIVEGR